MNNDAEDDSDPTPAEIGPLEGRAAVAPASPCGASIVLRRELLVHRQKPASIVGCTSGKC
jgi:hypothetical protein